MLQNIAEDIDSVESEIEEAMVSRNKLEELITRLFASNKAIRFTDDSIDVSTASGSTIGLESLSSGEKHLLLILVGCLMADVSSLIVDEPEISLHIDWQRHLVESMHALSPQSQLILATHSPEIMAGVSDDKIFRI